MLRGFDLVGLLAELVDELGVAAVAEDSAELPGIIVHETHAVDDDVIDAPIRFADQPVVERDLRFAGQNLGPHLSIIFFVPLVEELHAVARIGFDFVGVRVHEQRLEQRNEFLLLLVG